MKIYEVIEPTQQKKSAAAVTAELLFDHCQPFLTAIQHDISRHVLWRGDKRTQASTVQISNPTGREPTDTDAIVHDIANEWFGMNFGVEYRSEALFASGDKGMATQYGTPCMVFPKGNFQFCYSHNITDFTTEYQNLFSDNGIGDSIWWERKETNGEELNAAQYRRVYNAIVGLLEAGRYKSKGLIGAINSGSEIMIHAPEGFIVAPEYMDVNGVTNVFIYVIAEEMRKLS
jgi:hypothetical protein